MSIKSILAVAVVSAACTTAFAGGEIQSYASPYAGYSAYGAYGAPAPMNYARPASAYYGGGYNACNPCASAPHGYAYGTSGGFGGILGNDLLTAGLVGVGVGYLLFH